MTGRKDFTIKQGTTWRLPITIRHAEDQSLFDLTGYLGRGQIRRSHHAVDVIAELTVTISLTPEDGTLEISLTAEETSAIPAGETAADASSKYVYDVEIYTVDDADVKRILEGFIYINPEVTRVA
jgi:hypothetical protein